MPERRRCEWCGKDRCPYREVAEKAWDEGFMRANRLVNCRMCRGTTVPKINPYTV